MPSRKAAPSIRAARRSPRNAGSAGQKSGRSATVRSIAGIRLIIDLRTNREMAHKFGSACFPIGVNLRPLRIAQMGDEDMALTVMVLNDDERAGYGAYGPAVSQGQRGQALLPGAGAHR